jgi:hypothetical protein
MRSPAAAPRRPPARRPPRQTQRAPARQVPSNRSGAGRTQAPHHPLQLDLFGGGRPERPSPLAPVRPPARHPERSFAHLAGSGVAGATAATAANHPGGSGRSRPEANAFAELFRRLSRLTGGRLRSLLLTDNRRTILSVRAAHPAARPAPVPPAPIHLRIHRSFAGAPDPVLRAVAAFLASAKGSATARQALAAIREHFHHHRLAPVNPDGPRDPRHPQTRTASPDKARRLSLCPVGEVLDLREIAADLNQRYFEGRLKVRISWGKAAGENANPASNCRRTRSASLQLGSYSYEDRLIRIHRVLDRPSVPRYVVESVVYHELLHADLPPVTRRGRRYFHTPEFRRRERRFRHFERADCWVRDNLQVLLRVRSDAAAAAPRSASSGRSDARRR